MPDGRIELLRGGGAPVSLDAGTWRAVYVERGAAVVSVGDTAPVRIGADASLAIGDRAARLGGFEPETRLWLWQWRFAGAAPALPPPGLEACLAHDVQADPADPTDTPGAAILRFERVDLHPGGVTPRHTHAGCGLRVLVAGGIDADVGARRLTLSPGDAWLERGPGECVVGRVAAGTPAAFVRLMVLPEGLAGKDSYRAWDADAAALPRPAAYRRDFETRVTR